MSRFPCDENLLARHVEGQLSPREEQELIAHLEDCIGCRDQLEALACGPDDWVRVRTMLGTGPAVAVNPTRGAQELELPLAADPALDFLAPTDDPAMLGRLGSYEVKGVIGRGGMGLVLKAYDRALDRTIAIKVLSPHLAATATARRRFAREAQAAAAVVHENVIPIYAVAESRGLPYLVMPYLGGCSLQQRLDRSGALSPVETLRVARQVAAGLAAAHAQGLVHRDVKPANILLENGVERVTITDFGLARAADDASLTRSGVVAGTPEYMAPEQSRGEPVDHRGDLFSLGSVMYAMCVGHPPFRADSAVAVLRRVSDERARPIRESNPDVPVGLIRIIERLHAKSPGDRFASAAELADLLERYLAHVQNPMSVPFPKELARRSFWSGRIPRLAGEAGNRGRKSALQFTLAIVLCVAIAVAVAYLGLANSQPGLADTEGSPQVGTSIVDTGIAVPPWDDGIDERMQELDADLQPLREHAVRLWDPFSQAGTAPPAQFGSGTGADGEQTRTNEPTRGPGVESTLREAQPISLAWVPRDSVAVLTVRPARILQRLAVRDLFALGDGSIRVFEQGHPLEQILSSVLGISPTEVEQLSLVFTPEVEGESIAPKPAGYIIRAREASDRSRLLEGFLPPPLEQHQYGAHRYHSSTNLADSYPSVTKSVFVAPDERTVIVAHGASAMRRMLAAGEAGAITAPWANEVLSQPDADLMAYAATTRLRTYVARNLLPRNNATLTRLGQAAGAAKHLILSARIDQTITVSGIAIGTSAEDARHIAEEFRAAVTPARHLVSREREKVSLWPDGKDLAILQALDTSDALLDQLTIFISAEETGPSQQRVHFRTSADAQALAELIAVLIKDVWKQSLVDGQ